MNKKPSTIRISKYDDIYLWPLDKNSIKRITPLHKMEYEILFGFYSLKTCVINKIGTVYSISKEN